MANTDILLKQLREDIKKHRDLMLNHPNEEIHGIGAALDSFLLVSYSPQSLADLCLLLTYFINDQLGGEN